MVFFKFKTHIDIQHLLKLATMDKRDMFSTRLEQGGGTVYSPAKINLSLSGIEGT